MNQAQSQGHSTPLKCLGSQWYILSEVEDNCFTWPIPLPRKNNTQQAYLNSGRSKFLIQVWCYSSLYTKKFGKLLILRRAWNRVGLVSSCRLLFRLLYHFQHIIQQTQYYLRFQWQLRMLFEVLEDFERKGDSHKNPSDFRSRPSNYLKTTILPLRESSWP